MDCWLEGKSWIRKDSKDFDLKKQKDEVILNLDGEGYSKGHLEGKSKNSILDVSAVGYWLSFKWTYWVSSWIFKSEVQGQSHVKVGLIK